MKRIQRLRRHKRVTKKMRGSKEQPRLVVFRSKKHIYAQVINDSSHEVIIGASTLSKDFKEKNLKTTGIESAKLVGQILAQLAANAGIKAVCFDRAGYKYHGRIKSLAEGAREGGLKF
ncbi:MAG: 50S ribosomal protein L18 [Candidatus Omnitrophica bacterium]|nr:50S ribosomal protein L18 [Candidatus Omnitrophota bacterium]